MGEMKPLTLKAGTRVPFPEPTKVLVEQEPKSEHSKERSKTWGHFSHCAGKDCVIPESSPHSTGEDQNEVRAHKKAERSVKRIKGKLVKLGHNPIVWCWPRQVVTFVRP